MIFKSVQIDDWERTRRRISVERIMKTYKISEEHAQVYYDYLKSTGIVGRMGIVKYAE